MTGRTGSPSGNNPKGWLRSPEHDIENEGGGAADGLLGAFLAAAVVVVILGWIAALVYLFGFRLF